MVTSSCTTDQFRDSVLPCDIPLQRNPLRCANTSLVAFNATISKIGLDVLTIANRTYYDSFIDATVHIVPYYQPLAYLDSSSSLYGVYVNYPETLTIETIFSIDDMNPPTSAYRIYDDGASQVSMIYYTNQSQQWCSTVRFLQARFLPFQPYTFSIDFNELRDTTGITLRPGVKFHVFWSFDLPSGVSELCVGEFPQSFIQCTNVQPGGGPVLFTSSQLVVKEVKSLYKLFFSGMFSTLMDTPTKTYLHTQLPHIGLIPKFRTKFNMDGGRIEIFRSFAPD